jgi:hypothetical protein
VEKSLTYRGNKRQPPEVAVLQETQMPVEVTGDERRAKILINLQKTPTTEREENAGKC